MMKNLLKNDQEFDQSILTNELSDENPPFSKVEIPVILFITSYPPRECGIATYSQDLLAALKH
jgi:hypothetical protein